MNTCPKCLRPFNEGNSPNLSECHAGDDDEDRQCELSAKIASLTTKNNKIQENCKKLVEHGRFSTTYDDRYGYTECNFCKHPYPRHAPTCELVKIKKEIYEAQD